MSQAEIEAFEQAVIEQSPRRVVVVGSSISPDGLYATALTLLPTANDYLMDDLFVRTPNGWKAHVGGSGGGIQWTSLGDDERGVLRYSGEAPPTRAPRSSHTKGKNTRFLSATATLCSWCGTRPTKTSLCC